jgi:hypothetical protein
VPDRDDAVVCDEEPINELLVVLKAGGTEGASVTRARFLWEPLAVRLAGTRECADADLVACVACARARRTAHGLATTRCRATMWRVLGGTG